MLSAEQSHTLYLILDPADWRFKALLSTEFTQHSALSTDHYFGGTSTSKNLPAPNSNILPPFGWISICLMLPASSL